MLLITKMKVKWYDLGKGRPIYYRTFKPFYWIHKNEKKVE